MAIWRRMFQNRSDGNAMPDDLATTYDERWKPFKEGDPVRLRSWRPLRNLARRVRRAARNNGWILHRAMPEKRDVEDGMVFPTYTLEAIADNDVWVHIVCDPDIQENVIYAYGPALGEIE